jgi:3-dehydroquinate synthase
MSNEDELRRPREAIVKQPARVTVTIPASRPSSYDVIISPGVAASIGALLRDEAPAPHYAIIADANAARLHGDAVVTAVRTAAERVHLFELPSGERFKTRDTWARITDALLEQRFGRDGCIIALGGGVTTDLAGFVAATYMRGVACVPIPTTLLAMIDAAIGGKTGVDTQAGKNLVGAFLQPALVIVDPRFLGTLPDAELRSGLAEAVKHGAIADSEYISGILARADRLLARDQQAHADLIRRSVEIKAAVVERDPDERGERAALNFGHTIAHALERATGYGMMHGFAVAVGMIVEAEIGEMLGVTEAGTASTLRATLTALGLPDSLPANVSAREIIDAAAVDKKARKGQVRFTLLRRIGEVARSPQGDWTVTADGETVAAALALTQPPH